MTGRPEMRTNGNVRRFGDDCEIELQSVRVAAAPGDTPPFPVDAQTFEEDTNLILSAGPMIREPRESVDELVQEMMSATPARLQRLTELPGPAATLQLTITEIQIEQTAAINLEHQRPCFGRG